MNDLKDACSIVLSRGFIPVNASAYERLRAWLDATNGWPPKDWQPGDTVPGPPPPEPTYEYRVVCDGHRVTPWVGTYVESVAAAARDRADAACPWRDGPQHSHAIERRSIGPWERRVIGPWEAT